jgi:small subunit ribosomal protein S6
MAAEAPIYDLTVLLDADAPSERRAQILGEIEKAIGNGGEIVGKHDWGVRNLAYEIQHHKDAEYHLIQLKAPPELLERLRTTLQITDGVLRSRIIRLPVGMPPPPSLKPEPRAVESPPVEAAAPAAEAAPAEAAPAEAAPAEAAPAAAPAEAAPAETAAGEEGGSAEAAAPAEAPPAETAAPAEAPPADAPAEPAPE